LSRGYIKVTDDGTLAVTLVAQNSVDEDQRIAAIEGLSTEPTGTSVERRDDPLGFFDRHTLSDEEFQQIVEGETLADNQRQELRNYRADVSIDAPPDQQIECRITNAVSLPPENARFSGCVTSIPRLRYEGTAPKIGRNSGFERFSIQLHDGVVYRFPDKHPSYADARYNIENLNSAVPIVNAVGNTDTFRVDSGVTSGGVQRGDPSVLVPSFDYRAHPNLAVMRALTQRRALQLGVLGFSSPQQLVDQFTGVTQDTLISVLGTLGPTPPTEATPGAVIESAALAMAPVALAVAGPSAFAVGDVLLTGYALWQATQALQEWGETLQRVVEELPERGQFEDFIYDTQCPPDVTGGACDVPQNEVSGIDIPNASTVSAITSLSLFLGDFGVPALSTGSQFNDNLDTYRTLSEEIEAQAGYFEDITGGLRSELTATALRVFSRYSGPVPSREQSLLTELEESFAGQVDCDTAEPTPTETPIPVTGEWVQPFADPQNTSVARQGGPTAAPNRMWTLTAEAAQQEAAPGYIDGFYSPVVAGESLYVCAEPETVLAVNLADGSVQWTVSGFDHTPLGLAVDDTSVYVVTERQSPDTTSVYALSRAGESQWTFGTSKNRYSSLTLPALAEQTLFVSSTDGHHYALDTRNGDLDWEQTTRDVEYGAYGMPAVADGVVYVRPGATLAALEVGTGEPVWQTEDRVGAFTVPGPVSVADGQLLMRDGPRDSSGRDALFAYPQSSSETPERERITGPEVPLYEDITAPTVRNGQAYVTLESWGLQAIDLASGKPVWDTPHTLDEASETFLTDVVAGEDAVYYGSTGDDLYAVDPTSGDTLYAIDGGTNTGIVGNLTRIQTGIVATGGHLYTAGEAIRAWREP